MFMMMLEGLSAPIRPQPANSAVISVGLCGILPEGLGAKA